MPSENGKIMIGGNLYKFWMNKLVTKGGDAEVKLVIDENENLK